EPHLRRSLATRITGLAGLIAVVVVVIAINAASEGSGGHQLTILAPTADWMRPGLQVRIAGQVVGHVNSATPTRTGSARVSIEIGDQAWPLPIGTTASFRWPG